ncbi:MAG: hypothetical protein ACOY90_19735 [Candidatus Zhuqueibacterota bacterium]
MMKVLLKVINKLLTSAQRRVALFFLFFNGHRFARLYFFIFLILPIAIVSFFLFALPIYLSSRTPAPENQQTPPGENLVLSTIGLKDSDELRGIIEQMIALKIKKADLQNQLLMAKSDSVGLSIDLVDSVVALQIRGVDVRECKIQNYSMSPAFKHLKSNGSIIDWLSKPFVLEQHSATLPKMPIKIKRAPKDTVEAKLLKDEPVTVEKPDVQIKLQFDRNLVVEIKQVEAPTAAGRLRNFYHYMQTKYAMLKEMMHSYSKLQPYQVSLRIELNLSQSDSKAIYRALPHQAMLALRL